MIVRDRPNGVRLFLTMRGSVLPSIWKSMAITALLAVICRAIEIDMRDALGDAELPAQLLPVNYQLR